MSVLAWIIVGIAAGFIASMELVGGDHREMMSNLVLGLFGAFVGGGAIHLIGEQVGVTGLNLWSVLVSVFGAIAVLVSARLIKARRDSWSTS